MSYVVSQVTMVTTRPLDTRHFDAGNWHVGPSQLSLDIITSSSKKAAPWSSVLYLSDVARVHARNQEACGAIGGASRWTTTRVA